MSTEFDEWTHKPIEMPRAAESPEAFGPLRSEPLLVVAGAAPSSFDPVNAYLDRLGPGSWRTIHAALTKLADWASNGRCDALSLPWHLLRIEHTAALRTRLASTLAPATANKHLAALRGVLKQCW